MNAIDYFFLMILALWLFEGLKNIGRLLGDGTFFQVDGELMPKHDIAGIVALVMMFGPLFTGWYPAVHDKLKNQTEPKK